MDTEILKETLKESRDPSKTKPIRLKHATHTPQEDIPHQRLEELNKQKTMPKKHGESKSYSTLPDIQNTGQKSALLLPQNKKDLEFDYIGEYSISPSNQEISKHISTQNIINNLKSLNDYMDKRFPKIGNNAKIGKNKTLNPNNNHQQIPHKTQRNAYGDFYKNLMKPEGGKFVERVTNALSPNGFKVSTLDTRKNSSLFLFDVNAPLQSKFNGNMNPIAQMKSAKHSFTQMINLLSQVDKSEEKIKDIKDNNNQDLSQNNEGNYLKEYKKKFIDNSKSVQTKNLSFEKPVHIYKNYLKEQEQKSKITLQNSLSQTTLNASYVKEKQSFKNHLKLFNEDSTFIEEFNKLQDQLDTEKSKQNNQKQSGGDNEPTLILNCFKSLEHEFGRDDVQTFEKIIKDLLSDHIHIEDIVSKDELDKAMNQKMYAGFSMAPQIRSQIKDVMKDEYDFDLEDLEAILKDKKYLKKINVLYKRHLQNYKDALKHIMKLQKSAKSEDYASVIEEFKIFRVNQKLSDIRERERKSSNIFVENEDPNEGDESKLIIKKKNERYTAFIIYMAIQEMIKQIFVECRDKGKLLLKLFRKYFDEQEKNWFSIIQELCTKINKLKTERAFMLNKFIDKRNQTINNQFIKDELKTIVDDKSVNEENLINHKRLILELIGYVNREEDERYLMEVEKRNLENDVKDIIYSWDLVRSNMEFKERIRKVNTNKIKEDFNMMEEVRTMKKDDQAILINLERMRTALSTGNVQWDLEKIQLEGQNHFYKEENQIMKQEMKKLREQYEISQETLQERSKENFDLHQRLKKFTSHLDIIEKSHADVQTDVSFKNEEFTTSLDQILKNKLNNQLKKITKLMNKAKANVNRYQPMSKQEMMDLIQGVYIKKSQEINTKNELHKEFDDFVYSIMIQRFGTKKKADHKGQEFLLALKKYSKEDERVDFFKKFIGFEEANPYSREVLEFYIMLIKATNESIQNIISVAPDGQTQTPCEKIWIEFQSAFEKYVQVFNNSSSNLKEELKKHLIFDCELIIENQPKIEIKLNEKWELYCLLVFLKNTMNQNSIAGNIEQALIEQLNVDEESNLACAVEFDIFKQHFIKMLGGEDSVIILSVINIDDLFKKYFGVLSYVEENDPQFKGKLMVKIRGLKKIFRERYDFKITLRKFMDLGMKMSIRFSEEAKEYYGKIFKVFDSDGDGYITFKEFRKIIKKVDPQRSDWKIHAIYQKATGVDDSDKGHLKFNEFIKCAMNNVLMEKMIDWDKVLLEEKDDQNKSSIIQNSQTQKQPASINKDRNKNVKIKMSTLQVANKPSSSALNSGRSKNSSAFPKNSSTQVSL